MTEGRVTIGPDSGAPRYRCPPPPPASPAAGIGDLLARLDRNHHQFAARGEASLFGDAAAAIRDLLDEVLAQFRPHPRYVPDPAAGRARAARVRAAVDAGVVYVQPDAASATAATTAIAMLPGYDLADCPSPPDSDADAAPCPSPLIHPDHEWVLIYPDDRRRQLYCVGRDR